MKIKEKRNKKKRVCIYVCIYLCMYAYLRVGLQLAHPSMRGTVYRTSDPRAFCLMEKPVTTAVTISHVSTIAAAIRQGY